MYEGFLSTLFGQGQFEVFHADVGSVGSDYFPIVSRILWPFGNVGRFPCALTRLGETATGY